MNLCYNKNINMTWNFHLEMQISINAFTDVELNLRFQFYVILNGIKIEVLRNDEVIKFQFYVILNGIKINRLYKRGIIKFQFYVILNGIKIGII